MAGHAPQQSDHFHRGLVFSRPLRRGIRGIRVGIPKQYFFDRLQGDIRHNVLAACSTLEKLGATLQEVDLKGMRQAGELAATITVGEALAFHWKWLQTRAKDYGADLRERMKLSQNQRTVEYLQAQQKRRAYFERFIQAFESVDVLAAPTLPVVPPLIGQKEILWGRAKEDVRAALLRLTRPGNLTGVPVISLPCGFSQENLPIGLQLFGRLFDEATLLRVAYAYEQATPWHRMFPLDPECPS